MRDGRTAGFRLCHGCVRAGEAHEGGWIASLSFLHIPEVSVLLCEHKGDVYCVRRGWCAFNFLGAAYLCND